MVESDDHYSSLRNYILSKKGIESLTQREAWVSQKSTYKAFRKYISHVKQHGTAAWTNTTASLSRQQQQDPPEIEYSKSSSEVVLQPQMSRTTSLSSRTSVLNTARSSIRTTPVALAFSGMHCLLDQSSAPVSVVKFARQSTSLLAFGNTSGQLFIANVQEREPSVQQLHPSHQGPILSLDWALDSSCLLTCGADGVIKLWDSTTGACLREVQPKGLATYASFFPLNQGLLLAGTLEGNVCTYNASTGALVGSQSLPGTAKEHSKVEALTCSTTHVFVADGGGHIHSFRSDIRGGTLRKLTWLNKAPASAALYAHSKKDAGPAKPVLHLQYSPYTVMCRGPTLLAYSWDSLLTIFSFNVKTQRLESDYRLQLSSLSRRLAPTLCPTLSLSQPELLCLGWEDTSVHFIDPAPNATNPGPTPRHNPPHSSQKPSRGGSTTGGSTQVVNSLQGHLAPVVCVSWNADDGLLASGDSCGVVIVWKRDEGEGKMKGG